MYNVSLLKEPVYSTFRTLCSALHQETTGFQLVWDIEMAAVLVDPGNLKPSYGCTGHVMSRV